MALFRISLAAAIAYSLYRFSKRPKERRRAAFAAGESAPGPVNIRNAGPESMGSPSPDWDRVDEASDESYPASDPPAAGRFA